MTLTKENAIGAIFSYIEPYRIKEIHGEGTTLEKLVSNIDFTVKSTHKNCASIEDIISNINTGYYKLIHIPSTDSSQHNTFTRLFPFNF